MIKTIYFLSKDASWQKYRYDVFSLLSDTYKYKINILTTGKVNEDFLGNENVKYLSFRHFFSKSSKFCFFPGSLLFLFKYKPDILITQGHIDLNEVIAIFICKILSIKHITWTHGYLHGDHNKYYKYLKEYIQHIEFKLSNSIITFSEKGRKHLIKKGIISSKIFHAPNTLNTNLLTAKYNSICKKNSKEKIKIQLGIPHNSRIILYCGRLQKRKKVDLLIKALVLLRKKMNNVYLLIIGDGEEKQKLEEYSKELFLSNSISFLGSIYDEEILSIYYYISDVFVMPSWVGLSIVHAFCYHLPIITEKSDLHAPEIQYFYNNYNGLYYEKDNHLSLCKTMYEILNDRTKLIQFKKNAFDTVNEQASIDTMIEQINNAINYKG